VEVDCAASTSAPVNAQLLEQAVFNLIDNALKYSAKDKVAAIKAFSENGEVIIEIKDEGFGIHEPHLARIFERFYRVDQSRRRNLGGTGLGLAIVKHIVQALGGRIEVKSQLGA